jgi:hypothetical protein
MMVNEKAGATTAQQKEQEAVKRHVNISEDNVSCLDTHSDVCIDTAHTVPCRVNGIKEYNLSDETVLYSLECEIAHSLNSSAKAIWELCDGSNSIVDISQKLGKRFGCSGTDLLPDVTTTVTKLQRLFLLKLKNTSRTKSA